MCDPPSQIFRRRSVVRWWTASLISVFGLVFLSGMFTGSGSGPHNSPSVLQRVVCSVLLATTAVIVVRFLRLKVVLEPAHLCVHNWFHTYRIEYGQVVGVDPSRRYGTLRKPGIVLRLKDGRAISMNAYTRGQWDGSDLGIDVIDAIKAHIQQVDA